MDWSWYAKDIFLSYILLINVGKFWDIDNYKINKSPVIIWDTWSMLWFNNSDAESELKLKIYLLKKTKTESQWN